jgi:hypothetical protein
MTIQKRPIKKLAIMVGANQRGLSLSSGVDSGATRSGRLSFFFLRTRDFGMGGRLHERIAKWIAIWAPRF